MAEVATSFRSSLLPQFPRTHTSRSQYCVQSSIFRRRGVVRCSISAASTVRPIPWGCEIESLENAEALQRWLSESGLPPQKMGIDRVAVGERGLVALKNVRKGEKLLFVPPSLVITSDSEWTNKEMSDVMRKYPVPDWPLLATYLISEANAMGYSRWSRYISALPRQPYSLLYWSRSELDALLVASPIRERAIERINDVVGTYNDLRDRIFSKHPDLFPDEVYNMDTFVWSFGILFSRLVRLPSMDGKLALVPWADMLNHSSEAYAFLDYDKSSQGIVFTTDRSYQPGEQVFISYGKKSNGDLLLSYGFVPKEGSNPNDSVDLLVSLNKSDKCYEEKFEALKKYGLSTPQRFPIRVTGWPAELMAFAYLAVSPPSMSGQFDEMAAAASNDSNNKKRISYPDLEESMLQFILDTCESSISKYNKFLQTGGSLETSTSPSQINRKQLLKQLASDLCASEQRILYRTQYVLRRRLRDMKTGGLKALNMFNGIMNMFR
ncbi:rubisco methyltransferase family protein [Wolffia australiana]